jgi:hypothetical protein
MGAEEIEGLPSEVVVDDDRSWCEAPSKIAQASCHVSKAAAGVVRD